MFVRLHVLAAQECFLDPRGVVGDEVRDDVLEQKGGMLCKTRENDASAVLTSPQTATLRLYEEQKRKHRITQIKCSLIRKSAHESGRESTQPIKLPKQKAPKLLYLHDHYDGELREAISADDL